MSRSSARRRREATIRKLQAATGVDRELAEHMHDYQIEPQLAAQRAREDGLDVRVAFVNVAPGTEGHEVSCVRCGRTARLPFKPPDGKVLVCPDCARKAPPG